MPSPPGQENKPFWIIHPSRLSLGGHSSRDPRIPAKPPYSSRHTQQHTCPALGAELVGARGVPRRTEGAVGRCGQHTQGSTYLASSFRAHCEADSLAVTGHNPFPCQAPSPLKPHACTHHPCSGWCLPAVPAVVAMAAGNGRQQEEERHAWALPPCAGTNTLSSSAGAWQLHGYV